MSAQPQLVFNLAPNASVVERSEPQQETAGLFGLSLDHRALFEGLASEWLEPSSGQHGHLLVRDSYPEPRETNDAGSANLITVRAQVDLRADPSRAVWTLREGAWIELSLRELNRQDKVLWWPGRLSTHALVSLEVATNEERARLVGIARQVSNLSVPSVEVTAPEFMDRTTPTPPATNLAPGLSESYDRSRGAAAMGWWALPRTQPWFELLVTSFNQSSCAFTKAVAAVEAPWLAALPWRPRSSEEPSRRQSPDAVLWSAACRIAQAWTERVSTALATAIAEAAIAAAPEHAEVLLAWSKDTRAILRAERDLDEDTRLPVGTALQLVLARSSPERYRTWARDHQTIPPAVWWTGALLSGLFCGYQELPTAFRGEPRLREFLARRLLEAEGPAAQLCWSYAGDDAVQFQARGEVVSTKARTARGLWYTANLDDEGVHAAALRLVKRLGWPCLTRSILLRDQVLSLRGGGQLDLAGSQLHVTGELRMSLPPGGQFEEAVDVDAFKRALVTRGGELGRSPPRAAAYAYEVFDQSPAHVEEVPLDRAALVDADIPGLLYRPSFLTASESAELVEHIDAAPWLDDLKRRVQHYGWKYNYRAREISRDMQIGPLPDWALEIAVRMAKAKLMPWIADQLIVNEYVEKQGISKHIDCVPCFEEDIAMVSLVESWHMRFRPPEGKGRVDRELEVGSVAIMTGPARYDWTHEIPSRKKEQGRIRKRRISLTFRKVKLN